MKKSLISTLWVAAVFSLMGLLVSNQAKAECEVAYTCQFVDSNNDPSPWSLAVFYTGEPQNNGKYLWSYVLTGSASAINQVVTLAPVCCPSLGYTLPSGGQVLDPGAGDPTTGFGMGDFVSQAIRLAYNVSGTPNNSYSFYTNQRVTRLENATIQLKSGKALYYCRNIAIPACSIGSVYQPEIRLEEFFVKTRKIRVEWDEAGQTCNAVSVQYFDGSGWITVEPADTGPSVNNEPIKDCGPLEGNQKCKRCIVSGGTDSWAWLYIGGNWYLVYI
jgi:hypothetical protein